MNTEKESSRKEILKAAREEFLEKGYKGASLRSICKKAELNGTQKLAADVEKDGTVDIKDLRKILRYVCGKIEYL